MTKNASKVIEGEELNVLIGSMPSDEEKDTFKTSALEKKIAKEYAYYNGLKYALEIIEN